MSSTVVILTYHGLNARPSASGEQPFSRTVEDFKADLATIMLLGYPVVSFYDLLEGLQPDRDSVIIAFDDGPISVMDYAVPVLTDLCLKATMFVPGSHVGVVPYCFTADTLTALASPTNRLGQRLFTIESHGWEHVDFAELSAPRLDIEMRIARDGFASAFGILPEILALPFGHINTDAMQQAAATAGFRAVRTARAGVVNPDTSFYDLPSYLIHENSDLEVLLTRRARWPWTTPSRGKRD